MHPSGNSSERNQRKCSFVSNLAHYDGRPDSEQLSTMRGEDPMPPTLATINRMTLISFSAGVGKLRPAGRMPPATEFRAARQIG